jgi:serine protease Do
MAVVPVMKPLFSLPIAVSLSALSISLLSLSQVSHGQVADGPAHALKSQSANGALQSPAVAHIDVPASRAATLLDKNLLSDSSSLIADVAERVAASVVNIDVEKSATVRANPLPDLMPFPDELLQKFFGFRFTPPGGSDVATPPNPKISGNGSGVVLDAQGHILTNYHVVSNASAIMVTLNDGRKVPAMLTGTDRLTDLAVLTISADKLQPAQLGTSAQLRPGEWVLAIGSPLGFDHTVTVGIISALSRRVPDLNNNVQFIQTDAAINPGNSGGPLVNLKGQVIGINTAISGVAQNIGFAIPVDTVQQVTQDLIAHGTVKRPWIGLGLGTLTPALTKALRLPDNTEGILVSQVLPDSPSAKAGLKQGDVIQRLEGKRLTDPKVLQDTVRNRPINTPLNLQILRDGQLIGITLQTALMPADPSAMPQTQPMPNVRMR